MGRKKGEEIMIDTLQYILLGSAIFGIPALILALVISRRNGQHSSVLSIIPNEAARTPGQNRGSGRH
jgi:hypothetical protein